MPVGTYVGTYDVVTDSGTSLGDFTVSLGDGRPGFAVVSMVCFPDIETSTPGWSVASTHRSTVQQALGWCLWVDGDDPGSFDPTFTSNPAVYTPSTMPSDYGSFAWAAVAFLFDDPTVFVETFGALPLIGTGSASGTNLLSITRPDFANDYEFPDEFVVWTMGAWSKGTTGSISAVANSPLTNFISAIRDDASSQLTAGVWSLGDHLAGISYESPEGEANRTFTMGWPTGGGVNTQHEAHGTSSLFPTVRPDVEIISRKWWCGVAGWGGTTEPPLD